jgi:hypothetical protein
MTPRLPSGEVNRSYINGINPFKGYPGDEAAQRAQGAAAMEQVAEILEKTYEDDDSKIRFMKSFLRFVKEGATSVYRQRLDGASQDAKANIWAQDNENHLTMANEGGLAVAYTTYFPAFAELASRRAAEYIGILGLSVLEFVASDEEIPVLTLTGNLKEDVKEILRTYMLDIDPVIFTRVWARFNEFLQMLFDEAGKPDEAAKQFKKWRAEHPDAPEDEFAVVGHGAHARWHRREDQLLARRKAVAVGIGKISEPNRKARLRELQVKLTRDIVKLNKSRKKILRGRIIYTLIEDVRQIIKRQVYRAFTFPVIMSSISNEDLEQFAKDLGISLQDAAKGYNTQRAQVLRGKTGIDAMKGEDWNPDLIDPLEILKKALKDSDGKNSNDAVPNSEDDDPAERAAKEEKKEFVQEKFKALAKKLGYSTDKEVTMKESDALASYLKKNYGIELTGIHKLDVALLKMADEIEKLKEIKSSKWMTNSHPIFKGSDDEKVPDFDPRETPGLALIPGVDKEGERYTYFTRVRKSVLAHAEYALGIIEELIDFSSSNDDTSALEEMRNDIIAKVIRKEVGARRGQKIGESTTYDRSCTSGFGSWTKARF